MRATFSDDAAARHATLCSTDTAACLGGAVMKRCAGDTATYTSAQRLAKHTYKGHTEDQDTVDLG